MKRSQGRGRRLEELLETESNESTMSHVQQSLFHATERDKPCSPYIFLYPHTSPRLLRSLDSFLLKIRLNGFYFIHIIHMLLQFLDKF